MEKLHLTIIVILAVILTTLVYTMSENLEIRCLITLMDLPIVLLIANNMYTADDTK